MNRYVEVRYMGMACLVEKNVVRLEITGTNDVSVGGYEYKRPDDGTDVLFVVDGGRRGQYTALRSRSGSRVR